MPSDSSDNVLTFILRFDPDRAGLHAVSAALVDLGPRLARECGGLYRHWHSSRHFSPGVHDQLWFRFAPSPGAGEDLTSRVAALLNRESAEHGFALEEVIKQHTAQAFGEGDPRGGHDVVKMIGGRSHLPKLWGEIQQATEWAIADTKSGTVRMSLPDGWFGWAKHIYLNLMGLE